MGFSELTRAMASIMLGDRSSTRSRVARPSARCDMRALNLLMLRRLLEADSDRRTWPGPDREQPGGGSAVGWRRDLGERGGRSEGRYGKIKSHLTCGASQRRVGTSREARPFPGTSWLTRPLSASAVLLGVQHDCARAVVALREVSVLPLAILALGLHVNHYASARRALSHGGWITDAAGVGRGPCGRR